MSTSSASVFGVPDHDGLGAAFRLLAGSVLFTSSLIDLTITSVNVNGVSGQAVLTVIYFLCALAMLALLPASPKIALRLLPTSFFAVWSFASLAWTPSLKFGLQNALVISTFVLMLHLGAFAVAANQDNWAWLNRRLKWATGVAAVLAVAIPLAYGEDAEKLLGDRSFALFALLCIAQQLARWRYGARSGLFIGVALTILIGFGGSRLGFGVALLLFPLAQVPTRLTQFRRFAKTLFVLALSVSLGIAAVLNFEPLYDRFFRGDLTLQIGDLVINTSGRTAFWRLVLNEIGSGPGVIYGAGAGASQDLVESTYATIRHPHNDYLRVFYDYGVLGIVTWLFGLISVGVTLFKQWRRHDAHLSKAALPELVALMILVAFAGMMTTDNAIVYLYVTAPAGLFIGAGLASSLRSNKVFLASPVTREDLNVAA